MAEKFDIWDGLTICLCLYLLVANTLYFIPHVLIIFIAQYIIRRAAFFKSFIDSAKEEDPKSVKILKRAARTLKAAESTVTKDSDNILLQGQEDRSILVDGMENEAFWTPITRSRTKTGKLNLPDEVPQEQAQKVLTVYDRIDKIPRILEYTRIPTPQAKLIVPIGYGFGRDHKYGWKWADFGATTVHALIAGATKSGKDTLLKLWFMYLTRSNSPSELKFVILDGKGEWIVPPLVSAQHMFIPPAGSIDLAIEEDKNTGKRKLVDRGTAAMQEAIFTVFKEITRRSQEFQRVGVSNRERYIEKTGIPMPRLVIIATDVATNMTDEFTKLTNFLVSKGRSLGVHILISMQTTSNQDTMWRANLGLTICGFVSQSSQDGPIMGLKVEDIFLRPSYLPSDRPGMFVIRQGQDQYVVQAPILPDTAWEEYIGFVLPQKERVLEAYVKGNSEQDVLMALNNEWDDASRALIKR